MSVPHLWDLTLEEQKPTSQTSLGLINLNSPALASQVCTFASLNLALSCLIFISWIISHNIRQEPGDQNSALSPVLDIHPWGAFCHTKYPLSSSPNLESLKLGRSKDRYINKNLFIWAPGHSNLFVLLIFLCVLKTQTSYLLPKSWQWPLINQIVSLSFPTWKNKCPSFTPLFS